MIEKEILEDIHKVKKIKKIDSKDIELNLDDFQSFRIPEITVHGRFQPPLHYNHFYTYIANAFRIAEKVIILITNPGLDADIVAEAPHRSKKESNPFSYKERVLIFEAFFDTIGISKKRYEFRPFNITDNDVWKSVLHFEVPNLVNVYGEWSQKKLDMFRGKGYKVIYSNIPKMKNISNTKIREILRMDIDLEKKKEKLIRVGYMEETIKGLFDVVGK